jgi:hypothetical protein
MTQTILSLTSKPNLIPNAEELTSSKSKLKEAKTTVLIFLSSFILFGCGDQSYSNYEPYDPPSVPISEPSGTYPTAVTEPSSPSYNNSNEGQFALTPEEIKILQLLSTLSDEQITSILPEVTPEQIQALRSLPQTPTPTLNNNGYNPEVGRVIEESNNLITETNQFLQNPPTSTPSYQSSSNHNDNLTRSNHALRRELKRLNHNIEMEKLEELAAEASPYYYYNNQY